MTYQRLLLAGLALLLLAPLPDRMSKEDVLTALACAECSICPRDEQVAVIAVALTRARRAHKTIEQVVLARGQFADIDNPQCTARARKLTLPSVRKAMRGEDPTGGATHFHTHWVCDRNPKACWHPEIKACSDTVWPLLDEVAVPGAWKHRFYRTP